MWHLNEEMSFHTPHHDCNLPLLDSYLAFVLPLLLCNETQLRNITQLSCKRFMYAAAPLHR